MSFGGSAIGMINALKNNANLIRKRRSNKNINRDFATNYRKNLKYKQPGKEELERIKFQIRKDLKKQRRRNAIIILTASVITVTLVVFGFIRVYQRSLEKRKIVYQEKLLDQKHREEERQRIKEERILELLNEGHKYIYRKQYKYAKYFFTKAMNIDRNDYRVALAYAKAYAYDCAINGNDCDRAREFLMQLENKYGTNLETSDLTDLLRESQ